MQIHFCQTWTQGEPAGNSSLQQWNTWSSVFRWYFLMIINRYEDGSRPTISFSWECQLFLLFIPTATSMLSGTIHVFQQDLRPVVRRRKWPRQVKNMAKAPWFARMVAAILAGGQRPPHRADPGWKVFPTQGEKSSHGGFLSHGGTPNPVKIWMLLGDPNDYGHLDILWTFSRPRNSHAFRL